jgi:hypothetical protein
VRARSLKADYFPIAGKRVTAKPSAASLKKEKPYLCYPIGNSDEVPEKLVTFVATTAVPASASGHRRRRGQVIIDFFKLNDREQLHRERARMIVSDNEQLATGLLASHIPHTGCLRAYRRLWQKDNNLARELHTLCQKYAVSMEGTKPPSM